MMKRLLALSVAVLFVMTALVFAGCGKSESTVSNPKDSIDIKTLSASELMGVGMTVGLTDTAIPAFLTTPGDFEMGMKYSINKLSAGGEDLIDSPVSAGVSAEFDYDNTAAKMAVDFSMMGESGKLSAIVNEDGMFIDNLLGITNDVIGVSFEELGMDIEDIMQMLQQYSNQLNNYSEKTMVGYQDIIDSKDEIAEILAEAIADNVPDNMYETEITEFEINGENYKDVSVVTLTLDEEVLSDVLVDVVAGLVKIDSLEDIFGAAMGGYGFDPSMLSGLEGTGMEVSITTAVTNAVDTIYMDVEVSFGDILMGGPAGIAIRYSNTENYKNFEFGPVDEDGKFMEELRIMFFTYELDGTEETFEAGFYDDKGVDAYVEIEGTCKGNVHEGTFKMENLEFDYKFSGSRYDASLTISNLSNGFEELDVELTLDYKIADDCIELGFAVKGDIDGDVADMKCELYIRTKNITITTPKNYMSVEDIDLDTVMNWAESLEKKYPKLMEFFEDYAMGNSFGGGYAEVPDFDYDYDYDFGYDYSFDMDDYEDYLDDYSFDLSDLEFDYNF